jgi:hypothetical protein
MKLAPAFWNRLLHLSLLRHFAALCLLLLTVALAQAQMSTRQVSLPNQDYSESTEDLVVKVLGGQVVINRTWTWGKWYLNDKWADLVLQPDPLGGVLGILRIIKIIVTRRVKNYIIIHILHMIPLTGRYSRSMAELD